MLPDILLRTRFDVIFNRVLTFLLQLQACGLIIMAATILHHLWLIVALLALRAVADCASYGVDFANGGSYNIDGSSNEYFSFTTIFQGS